MRPRHRTTARSMAVLTALWLALLAVSISSAAPGTKTITFQDLMRFRAIQAPVISDDGTIAAYALQPDRGDGEGVVHVLASGKIYRVPRGGAPVIAKTGRHVGMTVKLSFLDSEKPAKDRPKPGLAIVETTTGAVSAIENAERLVFSDDGLWAAYLLTPPEPKKDEKATAPPAAGGKPGEAAAAKKPVAFLHLRNLQTGADQEVGPATGFGFDPASRYLAWAASTEDGAANGLLVRALAEPAGTPIAVTQAPKGRYESLTWAREGSRLAFLAAVEKEKDKPGPAALWIWDGASRQGHAVASTEQAPKGWNVPLKNDVSWSRDGKRVFFGMKPAGSEAAKKSEAAADPYDFDQLLSKVELDVWHWQDPRIQTQQKLGWEREKDRTFRAVLHVDSRRVVPLADLDMPEVAIPENARFAMGTSDVKYQRETTWGERYRDVYVVDLASGARKLALTHLRDQASLSPDGKWIAFFDERQWHLYDVEKGTRRTISSELGVKLFDEEHDTPDTPRTYGLGGWVDEGASLLVYDAYDIWHIPASGGAPVNLTNKAGRAAAITFRVVALDPEVRTLSSREPLLLSAYHNREKNWGFYAASFGTPGVQKRLDEPKAFRFVAKAKKAGTLLYTRQSYSEFPDLWVSDTALAQPRKVSDANPQLAEFAWGTAELVDYTSVDGIPLQGVLIKPANYQPGKRYPVITYFYERQSQRLHEFNEPVVNHRPSFAVYAGAGYAVFLPDIVFTTGQPGQSMLKCLVPGVQKLVDMGIADPKKLGLHGHSWGGYGTAYLVTQTNMFAAAVTGAPVANMTSAYGGIRWESGVARQFQYEQTQSRIGGSLWEYPERYIENSALFFADRITTPLLIEHGDEDGAVPWYQAIELYLALRRLDKDCIFLQYRGEPHHLRKYPNKLDYSIKMKEYFDHYLKGEPAAAWIKDGIPYRGK